LEEVIVKTVLEVLLALALVPACGGDSSDYDVADSADTVEDVADRVDADGDAEAGADADADADVDAPGDAVEATDEVPEDASSCPPAVTGVAAAFALDPYGPPVGDSLDLPCEMNSIMQSTDRRSGTFTMRCTTTAGEEIHRVDISGSDLPTLTDFFRWVTGVRLRYEQSAASPAEKWFTIAGGGGDELVAGVTGSTIVPLGFGADWYAPASVAVAGGLCPTTDDPCGGYERQALEAGAGADRVRAFDHGTAADGRLTLVVGAATQIVGDPLCPDTWPSEYAALLFLRP
jgi:hypothetical protein